MGGGMREDEPYGKHLGDEKSSNLNWARSLVHLRIGWSPRRTLANLGIMRRQGPLTASRGFSTHENRQSLAYPIPRPSFVPTS
ncbi:hypothetical protein R1flu_001032 [Riccia fluitans]|uniref:Uncharacterized protein n=1 Tax=Riccia fluitans TaxID=41844 RepID=A0ABD1Y525_9MARC